MSLDSMGPSAVGGSSSGVGTLSGTRMIHSLSTPSGVDGTISASHSRGGKKLAVRIQMLDDSVTMFQVQAKALGKVLFEQVCRQLNLLEADYFGLEYQEAPSGTKYWLDLEKPLNRQVGLSLIEPMLRFCVKFYTPDPLQLEEEYTRYLFCLQIKRDLATGSLQCNDNTAALMASYIVQASCGDYAPEDYPDHTYLSSYRFVPQQDHTMQRRIMENHKKHLGQSPAEADLNLLETARRCELYGMKMHPAKDHEGVPLNLAVAHMGIAVFQGITRINTFSWAKIRKISFKRKKFLIKLHPENYMYHKDTVEFFFEGRNECKNFWKKCVENHGFFRCSAVQNVQRRKARVLSRGSSFRYSGKTQKQIIEFVRDNYVKRQTFQRSQSFRQGPLHSSNRSQSRTSCNVNQSISAHPLLPIETAEWERRSQSNVLKTPSQMRKQADTGENHRAGSPTGRNRSQFTEAQVETYPTRSYAQMGMDTSSAVDHHQQPGGHQDSSRSASPGGTWSSPYHPSSNNNNNNSSHAREADRARVRQDGHNSDDYHGINGNVSLDRRSEVVQSPNRYELAGLGGSSSDRSNNNSLSRCSEAGTYDLASAETKARQGLNGNGLHTVDENVVNNNNNNKNNSFAHHQYQNQPSSPQYGSMTMIPGGTNGMNGGSGTLRSIDEEIKKKKWPTDRAYFLAKELLMTERTYKKDLDVLNTWFRDELTPEDVENLQPLFQYFDSMLEHHSVFLRDLEHRILLWEGRGGHETHRIGDVMLKNMVVLPIYDEYVESHREVLQRLNDLFENDERFQQTYRDFELQKVCYLPICYFVLKPLHRLLHYQLLLELLLEHYGDDHFDRTDCHGTLMMLTRTTEVVRRELASSENYTLLCEIQRDLFGFDTLVQSDRKLVRQGCLLKHSKRGLQQRMFFLFSDILLYAFKSPLTQTFKVLGHVPVRALLTENAEHNAFVIFGGQRAITVSAGTTAEKTLWLEELTKAAANVKHKPQTQLPMVSIKYCTSSEENLESCGLNNSSLINTPAKPPSSRNNTALHVCWHRGVTICLDDYLRAGRNQISGYLLRKFKNSSGWQKLWVVLTSFCLYFYKSYSDDAALASLPLLGYSVGPPGIQDAVQKEFVFKLSFKNHTYFFRAESEHTYQRWLEVLRSATQTQDLKLSAGNGNNHHSNANNNNNGNSSAPCAASSQ
ncbi:FERM, ARHGEF and pleckstrin domain-containing protein 2 isoform X3 [Wyeomyia smithii]|uniref:FERM, ARHGEF and pleckstrin domain-containing protein 2 isoform X3 n=1 Tax=Wyeomyia smithii TaxID=174621 RepID=UPI002467E628|nr:FERM, ARHGEF and pleckstrin domain-containing protein 2 isoform X3 [Wyeomyia smithii]